MNFQQRKVQCLSPGGLHDMNYYQWGAPDNPRVLICVHGLTRNGRDFDWLAERLAAHYRVICPDVVGRGLSSHLHDPAGYVIAQYVADMVTLIARLQVEQVDWLGTSMGGLIGMALAAQQGTPVRRLILNDIGPFLDAAALRRIAAYVGADPAWPSFAAAQAAIEVISAPFGDLTPAQWQALTASSIQQQADGQWRFRYDPRIAEPFKAELSDEGVDLWPLYATIRCPTLAVRGECSDLLSRSTWQRMATCGPCAQLVEIPAVGHAPMFHNAAQIAVVENFLLNS